MPMTMDLTTRVMDLMRQFSGGSDHRLRQGAELILATLIPLRWGCLKPVKRCYWIKAKGCPNGRCLIPECWGSVNGTGCTCPGGPSWDLIDQPTGKEAAAP